MADTGIGLEQAKAALSVHHLILQAILLSMGRRGLMSNAQIGAIKAEVLAQATTTNWKGANPADAVRLREAIEGFFRFWEA